MKKQLRDYQLKLVGEIYEKWEGGANSVLAQMPTGAGKSIVVASIVEHEVVNRGKKVLVMAHRTELVTQMAGHLYEATGLDVGIIKAGFIPNYRSHIQVASVQSLNGSRRELTEKFDLIVVDECHHYTTGSIYDKVIGYYDGARLLGVTATPERLDGKGLGVIFKEMVVGITTAELIESGHLSKFKYYVPQDVMEVDNLNVRMGDYTIESIEAMNPHQEVAGKALKAYQDYLVGKSTIVFATGVSASTEIAKAFDLAGISSAHLDGNTDSEVRRSTLKRFKRKEIDVISNCALFDEGLDIPGLDAVIMARPTKSLSKYLQQVGRALRVAEGKEHAIIIDLATNWKEHGLPNDERKWSLSDRPKKDKVAKTLKVSEDGEILEIVEVDEIEGEAADINFVEVANTRDVVSSINKSLSRLQSLNESFANEWIETLERLTKKQKQCGYKPGWLIHQIAELNAPVEIYYALADYLGYKRGWAFYKHRDISLAKSKSN
jgi:DNA repair protein RadD